MRTTGIFKILLVSLSYVFCASSSFGQRNICDTLVDLLSANKLTQARRLIIRSIDKNSSQKNCFFLKSLQIYDSSIKSSGSSVLLKDTVFKILNVWHTVQPGCEVFNEAASRYYLYKRDDKNYKDEICPYLKNGFLNCKSSTFTSTAVLSLTNCISNYSYNYDTESERYSCQIEEFAWKYIKDHSDLLFKPEWQALKSKLQYALLSCPFISCSQLDTLFLREIETQPLSEVKKMYSILSQKNCIHGNLYNAIAKQIIDSEPSFNGLYQFAKLNKGNGSLVEAYKYYVKAEKYGANKQQKSLCYLGIAELLEIQQKHEKAKEFAQIAIENDPNNQESFVFLASLYKNAEKICDLNSPLEITALYLLIAKNYQSGGAKEEAKKYYHLSNIEIQTKNGSIMPGQKLRIECFIKEEIELKK